MGAVPGRAGASKQVELRQLFLTIPAKEMSENYRRLNHFTKLLRIRHVVTVGKTLGHSQSGIRFPEALAKIGSPTFGKRG